MPSVDRLTGTMSGLEIRAAWPALAAAGLAWGGLQVCPDVEMGVFARGAAALAGLLAGSPVVRVDEGWLLASAAQPVVVSAACSAVDFFVMVAALLGWRLGRGRSIGPATGLALIGAVPLTLAVNGLRVVVVMQAHRWVIPRFPDAYGPFLHLVAGVAVFLPALIGLNLLLEFYGTVRRLR